MNKAKIPNSQKKMEVEVAQMAVVMLIKLIKGRNI
jgi:hypothetical protein